ncbi:MAG: zinc and cadmium transporter [Patescibacteria group bacterium]|nr:zinc and cadmium transporter [Patescibacteria group bacterium]
MTLIPILISTFLISMGALAGAFTLALNRKRLQTILLSLVSLSAGTLMGGAFLHLLPESLELFDTEQVFLFTLLAFVGFFLIERVLHWHHCHDSEHEKHTIGFMNLIGDGVHNFLDGLILAAAYSVDIQVGIATTIAVALHEIPQEISDFGVLLHSGYKVKQALILNFSVALLIVAGGVVGFFMAEMTETISGYLMPIAAGGFIYIAAADLLPEIRQERKLKNSLLHISIFIIGIMMMYFLAHAE